MFYQHQKRTRNSADPLQSSSQLVVHGDIINAGGDVSITNGDRNIIKRSHPCPDGPSGPAKRRAPVRSPTPNPHQTDDTTTEDGDTCVCQGDVVQTDGNVNIVNGDRQTEQLSDSYQTTVPPEVSFTNYYPPPSPNTNTRQMMPHPTPHPTPGTTSPTKSSSHPSVL